jgi:hypothetical protein
MVAPLLRGVTVPEKVTAELMGTFVEDATIGWK